MESRLYRKIEIIFLLMWIVLSVFCEENWISEEDQNNCDVNKLPRMGSDFDYSRFLGKFRYVGGSLALSVERWTLDLRV